MEFKKYPSIENHYRNKHIDKWLSKFPELKDEEFIVTEKLHGSNFQVLIDRYSVRFASRNNLLEEDSKFYDHKNVMQKYSHVIDSFQNFVKSSDVNSVRLFGELFGEGVQKGVNYGKEKSFRLFDIYFDDVLISQDELIKAVDRLKLNIDEIFVPVVGMVKGLYNALTFDTGFNSTILGIDNNICEGVVIKPFNKTYVDDFGSVFYLKKKNEEFKEKQKSKKQDDSIENTELTKLQLIYSEYLNENRIETVFSKYGQINDDSEIGMYIKFVIEDAKEDFIKDNEDELSAIDKKELDKIFRISGKIIVPILKKYL